MDQQQLKDYIWNAVKRMENGSTSECSFGGGALSFGYMQNDVSP